jgi:hypothetical protein
LSIQGVIYTLNLPLKVLYSAIILVLLILLFFKDIKGLIKILLSVLKGKKIQPESAEQNANSLPLQVETEEQEKTLDKN